LLALAGAEAGDEEAKKLELGWLVPTLALSAAGEDADG
jgi:hypothetical protein